MVTDAPPDVPTSRRPEGPSRRRLTPAIAEVRGAVRSALGGVRAAGAGDDPLVLVALSGGADSLALTAATVFEGPRAGFRVGAAVIDHGLQVHSAEVAAPAAAQARALGCDPVLVHRVEVANEGGPEASARQARYRALDALAVRHGAFAVLLGHTLDDQAETVLLGPAGGSGAASLSGMAPGTVGGIAGNKRTEQSPGIAPDAVDGAVVGGVGSGAVVGTVAYLRPLLGTRRATTRQACLDAALTPWDDPHNADPRYTRVRVRDRVLPVLEAELGPGIAQALARTAEQLREDEAAFTQQVAELIEEMCEPAEAGIALSVGALAANPAALRQRLIRYAVEAEFGVSLSRFQTLEVARLVTAWHGQGPIDLPSGVRVTRGQGLLTFPRLS